MKDVVSDNILNMNYYQNLFILLNYLYAIQTYFVILYTVERKPYFPIKGC